MNDPSTIYRVAVIGPESSGKSNLCEALAAHYQTAWVPEYARDYLKTTGGKYNIQDIIKIYTCQYQMERQQIPSANRVIFTDTEAIIA